MKVFISSLISGFETFRDAAREAVTTLRHTPVMAEALGAQPNSPQVACLAELRKSDVMLLILGQHYGAVQASGKSATHEEYLEAKDRKPIIAFVQAGVTRDAQQAAFVSEVQAWVGGVLRESFRTPYDLQNAVLRTLHDYDLANAVGPVNPDELTARAIKLLPKDQRNHSSVGASLALTVAGGPTQSILRPIEIEDKAFIDKIQKELLFGDVRLFNSEKGSTRAIQGQTLTLSQPPNGAFVSIDEQGTILIKLPFERSEHSMLPVLIEEEVRSQLTNAVNFAAWLVESIDAIQRITHVAIAAQILDAGYTTWRTEAENRANPNSMQGGNHDKTIPVSLVRPRPAMRVDTVRLIEDIFVPLRRQWKT